MIGRRVFVAHATFVALAPTIANLALLASAEPSRAAPVPSPSPGRRLGSRADTNGIVFKVDGWDRTHDSATDGSPVPSVAHGDNADPDMQVWIRVNRSWRVAWR